MFKNIYCSCGGPGLGSQHLHGGSEPSVTPVLGYQTSGLRYQTPSRCTYIQVGKMFIHKKKHFFNVWVGGVGRGQQVEVCRIKKHYMNNE